jgi:electron transfer flavoprotein beta subunit
MRTIMPALQKAQPAQVGAGGVTYKSVEIPKQRRDTKIVNDVPAEEIAREIIEWLRS